ncbi:nuclear nucleic acid-binding protein C1D-like, partial [Ruditapes philippinarum]|uniref:nuclear nucleic acid-binding protein C1D-like n=1 Tax=Ruditapes philippinarum TaxID=129788 RepID=UPI00295C2D17
MSGRDKEKRSEIPHELRGKVAAFDSSLNNVENEFEPLLKLSQIELNAKLSNLEKAKLDLVAAYSINSLFWMYLNVCGVNPKDHGIKQELDRIRSYMNRVKEIQDKEKAPKIDVSASKRMVKSALWQAAQNQQQTAESSKDNSTDDQYVIRKGKRMVKSALWQA